MAAIARQINKTNNAYKYLNYNKGGMTMEKNNSSNISIHTFTVTYSCDNKFYNALLRCVTEYIQKNNKTCYPREWTSTQNTKIKIKTFSTNSLREKGINEITFKTIYAEASSTSDLATIARYVLLLVNPQKLLGKDQFYITEIVKQSNLDKICKCIDFILSELCPHLSAFSSHRKFSRIDYCTNLWFLSNDIAQEYLRLLKAAWIPYNFSMDERYDPIQHRQVPGKYDFSIKCKSYEFSFYLKQKQMLSRKSDFNYPDDEIAHADGQLRMELRANRRKLHRIQKTSMYTEEALITEAPNLSIPTFSKNISYMYGSGDFYSYSEAKNIIKHSPFSKKAKEQLLYILKEVKKYRSLDPDKNGLNPQKLRRYIKEYFNVLGLSPITIPKRYSFDYYPNPLQYIFKNNTYYLKSNDDM